MLLSVDSSILLYRILGTAYLIFFPIYFIYRLAYSIGERYLPWRYFVLAVEFFASISVFFMVILKMKYPLTEWVTQAEGSELQKQYKATQKGAAGYEPIWNVAGDRAKYDPDFFNEESDEEGGDESKDERSPLSPGKNFDADSEDEADGKRMEEGAAGDDDEEEKKEIKSKYIIRVLVPCYKESLMIVRETCVAALNVEHPKDQLYVYICDDGNDPYKQLWVKSMKQEFPNLNYVCRPPQFKGHGKAGNLNYTLRHVIYKQYEKKKIPSKEICAIFDADMVCLPKFVSNILHYFDDGKRVVMVQTPQTFYNIPMNADFFDAHNVNFFQYVLPAMDSWNTTTCCGTNFLVRAKALRQVGWFPTLSITEDMHLAMQLLSIGGVVRYHAENLVIGEAPLDMRQIFQQRSRWAKGTIQIWLKDNPLYNQRLNWMQRLSFFNATYSYITSAFMNPLFVVINAIAILFGLFPVRDIDFTTAMLFVTYYSLFYTMIHFTPNIEHYTSLWVVGKMGHFFSFMALKAIVNVFKATYGKRKELTFKVTAKKSSVATGGDADTNGIRINEAGVLEIDENDPGETEESIAQKVTMIHEMEKSRMEVSKMSRFEAVPEHSEAGAGGAMELSRSKTWGDREFSKSKSRSWVPPKQSALKAPFPIVPASEESKIVEETKDDVVNVPKTPLNVAHSPSTAVVTLGTPKEGMILAAAAGEKIVTPLKAGTPSSSAIVNVAPTPGKTPKSPNTAEAVVEEGPDSDHEDELKDLELKPQEEEKDLPDNHGYEDDDDSEAGADKEEEESKSADLADEVVEKRDSTHRDIIYHWIICSFIVFVVAYGLYIIADGYQFLPELPDERSKLQKKGIRAFCMLWMVQFFFAYSLPMWYAYLPASFSAQAMALKVLSGLDTILSIGLIIFTVLLFKVPFLRGVPEIKNIKDYSPSSSPMWVSRYDDLAGVAKYMEDSATEFHIPVVVLNTRYGRNYKLWANQGLSKSLADYKDHLTALNSILKEVSVPGVVVLEPGWMYECFSVYNGTDEERDSEMEYLPIKRDAEHFGSDTVVIQINTKRWIDLLDAFTSFSTKLPTKVWAYIDGGSPYFQAAMGYEPLNRLVKDMDKDATGASKIRGVAINTGEAYSQEDSILAGTSAFANFNLRFVVDSSVNGGERSNSTLWEEMEQCRFDPPRIARGEEPRWNEDGDALDTLGMDATLYVKIPGMSDGRLYPGGEMHECLMNHDFACDSTCPEIPTERVAACQCDV